MEFWLDGQYRDDPAAISIRDRGFLLGDGAFETFRLSRGAPVFASEHVRRLKATLALLAINVDLKPAPAILAKLAGMNGLAAGEAVGRLTVTRGAAGRGLAPTNGAATMLATVETPPPTSNGDVRLIVSKFQRYRGALNAGHKLLAYHDNLAARREALSSNADDAIMLNDAGRPACASAANIFVITDDDIVTPPVDEGALPGIVRQCVIDLGARVGAPILERPLTMREVEEGRLFLTNSLIGLRRAHLVPSGPSPSANAVFMQLSSAYNDLVTRDIEAFQAGP